MASRAGTSFVAAFLIAIALGACGHLKQRKLVGHWESEESPVRTLDLFADGTYTMGLKKRGLAILSELVAGADRGQWRVEGEHLVLVATNDRGVESSRRLPISELEGDQLTLAGERWRRAGGAER